MSAPAVRLWRSFQEFDDLEEENRQLRAEIDAQRSAEISAQNAIIENQDLLALAGLESLASYGSVTGRLVGQSPSNFDQQVEIDRGALHGIRRNGGDQRGRSCWQGDERCAPVEHHHAGDRPFIRGPSEDFGAKEEVPGAATSTTVTPVADSDGAAVAAVEASDEEATESIAETTTTVVEIIRETGVLRGQGSDRLPRVSFIAPATAFGQIEVGDTVFTAGGSTSLRLPTSR